jgi:hypothetical protein
MAHSSFIADSFDYGRELLHAGIDGIKAGERLSLRSPDVHIAKSAGQSLVAAAVGGTVALILCKVTDRRRRVLQTMVACGTAAFCADFICRTRNVSSKMIECAEKEIGKVRDQHWLESNPIDYA